MKSYIKITFLFALCFSLYGCPEGKEKETNTVDLAMNDSSANANEVEITKE